MPCGQLTILKHLNHVSVCFIRFIEYLKVCHTALVGKNERFGVIFAYKWMVFWRKSDWWIFGRKDPVGRKDILWYDSRDRLPFVDMNLCNDTPDMISAVMSTKANQFCKNPLLSPGWAHHSLVSIKPFQGSVYMLFFEWGIGPRASKL